MGKQSVPIPESTLRRIADAAYKRRNVHLREGRPHTAESIKKAVHRSIELTANAGGPGRFVSIEENHLSSLAAQCGAGHDARVARLFLERYGVW